MKIEDAKVNSWLDEKGIDKPEFPPPLHTHTHTYTHTHTETNTTWVIVCGKLPTFHVSRC